MISVAMNRRPQDSNEKITRFNVVAVAILLGAILLDSAALGPVLKWTARVAAPVSAAIISGGFFGLAFAPAFAALVYLGAAAMALSVGLAGIGLLRARQ